VRAMNTLQQQLGELAHCENVMVAVKTLWERLVDAEGTYFAAIPQHADMVLEWCTNAVQTLWHRRLV